MLNSKKKMDLSFAVELLYEKLGTSGLGSPLFCYLFCRYRHQTFSQNDDQFLYENIVYIF